MNVFLDVARGEERNSVYSVESVVSEGRYVQKDICIDMWICLML